MYNQFQRLVARLVVFGLTLQSCASKEKLCFYIAQEKPGKHKPPKRALSGEITTIEEHTAVHGGLASDLSQPIAINKVVLEVERAEQGGIDLASRTFTTSSGLQVGFSQKHETWQAQVIALVPGASAYSELLPVVCQGNGDIGQILGILAKTKASIHKYHIHVLDNLQPPSII